MSLYDSLFDEGYVPPRSSRLKLAAKDVGEIRRLYATQGWSQQSLAREFGVSQPQISKIVNNLQWKGTSNG